MAERKSGVEVDTLISLSLICPDRPIHWSIMNSQPELKHYNKTFSDFRNFIVRESVRGRLLASTIFSEKWVIR